MITVRLWSGSAIFIDPILMIIQLAICIQFSIMKFCYQTMNPCQLRNVKFWFFFLAVFSCEAYYQYKPWIHASCIMSSFPSGQVFMLCVLQNCVRLLFHLAYSKHEHINQTCWSAVCIYLQCLKTDGKMYHFNKLSNWKCSMHVIDFGRLPCHMQTYHVQYSCNESDESESGVVWVQVQV